MSPNDHARNWARLNSIARLRPAATSQIELAIFVEIRDRQRRARVDSTLSTIAGHFNTSLPDFCASPDGQALYYSVLELSVSQIRMVEGGF